MGRGLRESAATLKRPDPLPTDMFGPIREQLCQTVTQKVRLLGAECRVDAHGGPA